MTLTALLTLIGMVAGLLYGLPAKGNLMMSLIYGVVLAILLPLLYYIALISPDNTSSNRDAGNSARSTQNDAMRKQNTKLNVISRSGL